MRERSVARISAVAALLLASVILAPVGAASAAPKGSPWGANYFPNVALVTQDGKTVQFYDDLLKDKLVLVNFIYTNCKDTCALMTAKLVQLQRLLGDRVGRDIFMYSITTDPKRDTPAVLKDYADKFHVRPGWLFLTGKQADIEVVRKKLGLYATHDTDDPFDHTTNVVIGNEATGQWIRNSAFDNPQYLAVMLGDWLNSWKDRKPVKSYAEVPRMAVPEKGQQLFKTRCAACHTIGKGDGLGPDLLGVTSRRDPAWLARWLAAPDQMLAEGDPVATALLVKYKNVPMPNLQLGGADVAALISYMESRSAAVQGTESTASLGAEKKDSPATR